MASFDRRTQGPVWSNWIGGKRQSSQRKDRQATSFLVLREELSCFDRKVGFEQGHKFEVTEDLPDVSDNCSYGSRWRLELPEHRAADAYSTCRSAMNYVSNE
uniref:Uncharacterized protein n=1 Tax=Grammatophora oceanica TaxID=210454 RepID=A0A7S1Y8K2_9STRA|mmetsp:Transcript_37134/g.55329  ORF Transcript_37134/g.55329 Transcript_37134/m.55329 type:complete len:102 (+) Transcript_37134:165-470(+)